MVIDPHAEYGIAASRKHLQRVKGSPGFAIDALDPSGRGVLLQFPAPVDQLPQPAPLFTKLDDSLADTMVAQLGSPG